MQGKSKIAIVVLRESSGFGLGYEVLSRRICHRIVLEGARCGKKL